MRSQLAAMTPEQKAGFDGEFLMAIAEKPNEILKCAMYLFAYRCVMQDHKMLKPSHAKRSTLNR